MGVVPLLSRTLAIPGGAIRQRLLGFRAAALGSGRSGRRGRLAPAGPTAATSLCGGKTLSSSDRGTIVAPGVAAFAAACALLVLGACGGEGDDGGPTTDDAGPETWTVDADPIVRIGRTEGDSDYLLSEVAAVRILPNSAVAVADRTSGTVRIFDTDGTFVRSMGRIGEGPGEFSHLSELRAEGHDTLAVYDSDLGRLTRFTHAGAVAGTVRLNPDDARPAWYAGALSDGSTVALGFDDASFQEGSGISADPMVVALWSTKGAFERRLASFAGLRRYRTERAAGPIPMSPQAMLGVLGDTVFYGDGMNPVVHAVSQTTTAGSGSSTTTRLRTTFGS